MARAYNDWIYDWCSVDRERLYSCAALPSQNPVLAADELRRVAKRGFKVAGLRAALIHGRYPNQPIFEPLWQALEETGIVAGMHSLPQQDPDRFQSSGTAWKPPSLLDRAIGSGQIQGGGQTLGFAHMAMTWMTSALLSGFFERHPGLTRMAIMESNASWLPMLLEECDRAFRLYKGVRNSRASQLPSELFFERCFIAFEGDEKPVYKQYSYFREVGIWSSDVYHHDGADAWSAIRDMECAGVPVEAQAKLMGGNARRMYGIEPRMVTTTEPSSYDRPDWYPKPEEIEREFAGLTARR
jgi:predicted TIM-barrel fold metal-dependent hydrolase